MLKIHAVITLGAALFCAPSLFAQTTLVTDNFDSAGNGNGLNGRTTPTGNVQWITNSYNTVPEAWSSGLVAADYTGNNSVTTVVPLSGFTLGNTVSVSALLFHNKSAGDDSNYVTLGLSGAAAGSVTNGNVQNGSNFGILAATTNSLSFQLGPDGSGQLRVNGTVATTWATPTGFTANAANTGLLSFNTVTDRVTVTIAGTTVVNNFNLTFLAAAFAPTYAGYGEFYGKGWNGNGTTASGFDNFSVTTVPEPRTYAAALIGTGLCLVALRKRNAAARV